MKRKPTYSQVIYILFGLAALTGLLMVFLPLVQSLPDPVVSPGSGQSMGLITPITITFPAAMNRESVEKRIRIIPESPLRKTWNGNTLTLTPEPAFNPGTDITIRLSRGASGGESREYKSDLSWTYHVRMPVIAYLGEATTSPEIWVTDLNGSTGRKVTQTNGNITGFTPLPDGSGFLYAVKNTAGGADIHRINLDGSQDQMYVDCGKETCGDPAVSRDGRLYTFSRNRDPEDGTTSKWTYIYTDLMVSAAHTPAPLVPARGITGILPSFSPDGLKISFYDANSKGIRIMNQVSGTNDFLLGTNRVQSGSWSPDGSKLAFVDDVAELENYSSNLYMVDLSTSSIGEPLKTVLTGVELGEPDWSPDGNKIAVGIRSVNGFIARQMTILNLADTSLNQITGDFTLINAAPKWRPDGKSLVFQQAQLTSSGNKPKVILWDASDGKFTTVAADAAMPAWLP